jgi:N-acetylornithine carbamoyltransferase
MIERFGDLRGRTATVSWAYASSYQKPISVPQSLVTLLPRFGMNVRLVHPPEFSLMSDVVEQAKDNAHRAHTGFEILHDFDEGIRGTDVVYAKSWGALLTTTDETEGKAIIDKYADWIADERRMSLAGDDAVYMHPLPADRNVEVADAVIDGPRSVVYDQAENRLHGQKAVMALTMS